MALFAIADLHLSLSDDKPMDVFSGWSNYVERIEKNWKAVVKESDTVVIAGDISWAMDLEGTKKDFDFIEALPGKKILLKGNHDYWWSTKAKMERFFAASGYKTLSILFNNSYAVEDFCVCGTRGWFYDVKTDEDKKILNREVGRLRASINSAKSAGLEPVVFLHYPPVYGTIECSEIFSVLLEENISKCYYGHIHGGNAAKKAITGNYRGVELQLISCDYMRFMPMLVR